MFFQSTFVYWSCISGMEEPFRVNKDRCRKVLNPYIGGAKIQIKIYRKFKTFLLNKIFCSFLVRGTPSSLIDQKCIILVLHVSFIEISHFINTVWTPCCPKVDYYRFPIKSENHLLALVIVNIKIRAFILSSSSRLLLRMERGLSYGLFPFCCNENGQDQPFERKPYAKYAVVMNTPNITIANIVLNNVFLPDPIKPLPK